MYAQAPEMVEPELPGIPSPALPPWWRRPLRLVTKPKLPGWAFFLFLVIEWVPDWKGRLDFWLDAAQKAGGYTGYAATMISSPYFSLAMAASGVIWLAFIGEPTRGVLRDPRWRYLGWGIVAALVIVITTTVGYGYFEIRVREVAAARATTERHLTDNQKACLTNGLKNGKNIFNAIQAFVTTDENSGVYFRDFVDAFDAADVNINVNPVVVSANEEHDVMIGVRDPKNPPGNAGKFADLLNITCQIPSHFVLWRKAPSADAFDLYIAPTRN